MMAKRFAVWSSIMAAPTVWWLLVLAASAARAQNVPHQIRFSHLAPRARTD
jgi:hypothetical protein